MYWLFQVFISHICFAFDVFTLYRSGLFFNPKYIYICRVGKLAPAQQDPTVDVSGHMTNVTK